MKKLICFLLMVMMTFTLCSCEFLLGNRIDELPLEHNGAKISNLATWSANFTADYESWEKSRELHKEQWFSISGKETTEYSSSEVYDGISKTEVSGKYFYSPYAFESKYSLKIKTVSEYTSRNEEGFVTATYQVSVVHVEGVTYVKTETKYTSQTKKESAITYSKSFSHEIFSTLKGLIESPETALVSVLAGAITDPSGSVYASDDTFEVDIFNLGHKTQYIIDFDEENFFVKGVQFYSYNDSHLGETSSTTTRKYSVKKASFGSAKRPKDYYKYESKGEN